MALRLNLLLRIVSINSPSGEGGEQKMGWFAVFSPNEWFPLILLQAKAVSPASLTGGNPIFVSINSPSGEGGELRIIICMMKHKGFH